MKRERGLYSPRREIIVDEFVGEKKTLDESFQKIKETYNTKSWKTPKQLEKLDKLKTELKDLLEQYKLLEYEEKISEANSLLENMVKKETIAESYWKWEAPKRKKQKQKFLAIGLASLIGLGALIGAGPLISTRKDFINDLEDLQEISEDAYSYGNYKYSKEINTQVLKEIGVFALGKEKDIKKEAKILQKDLQDKLQYAFLLDVVNQVLSPYYAINYFYGRIIPNKIASNLLTIGTITVPTIYGYRKFKKWRIKK